MKHPFDLKGNEIRAKELDFEELITHEEAENIKGGIAILPVQPPAGIPYGCYVPTPYWPKPLPFPSFPLPTPYPQFPICYPNPSLVTTLALGEEGGSPYFC